MEGPKRQLMQKGVLLKPCRWVKLGAKLFRERWKEKWGAHPPPPEEKNLFSNIPAVKQRELFGKDSPTITTSIISPPSTDKENSTRFAWGKKLKNKREEKKKNKRKKVKKEKRMDPWSNLANPAARWLACSRSGVNYPRFLSPAPSGCRTPYTLYARPLGNNCRQISTLPSTPPHLIQPPPKASSPGRAACLNYKQSLYR